MRTSEGLTETPLAALLAPETLLIGTVAMPMEEAVEFAKLMNAAAAENARQDEIEAKLGELLANDACQCATCVAARKGAA